MFGEPIFRLKIAVVLIAALGFACAKSSKQEAEAVKNGRSTPVVIWDGRGIDTFAPVISSVGDGGSLAMALSRCECASKAVTGLLAANATIRGVLPQVLVPQIRESIAGDSKLKILSQMPPVLGDFLKGMLATDEKLAGAVRDGVSAKLKKSLGFFGGTNLSDRTAFRMDLFSPVPGQANRFDMSEQSVRWNLVMGREAMWTGKPSLDGVDHGLQLLETMRVAAEWAYIAGLGSNGKPSGFGGLALDVMSGPQRVASTYDPNAAPVGAGLFAAGGFSISYANGKSVDMATKVKESWTFAPGRITLLNQSRVWRSAALAMLHMRTDRPTQATGILGAKDGALSAEAQKLPLIWLPGMGELIKTQFVNRDTRLIKANAYGDNTPADLEALITFAEALHYWRLAVSNLSRGSFSPELVTKLKPVPDELLVPLQLAIQTIIANHTFVTDGASPKVYVGSKKQQASPRLAAMTISLLGSLEQEVLTSSELKLKVLSLFSSHAPLWAQNQTTGDAATLVEQLRAATVASRYQDAQPWVAQLRGKLAASVTAWGGT